MEVFRGIRHHLAARHTTNSTDFNIILPELFAFSSPTVQSVIASFVVDNRMQIVDAFVNVLRAGVFATVLQQLDLLHSPKVSFHIY